VELFRESVRGTPIPVVWGGVCEVCEVCEVELCREYVRGMCEVCLVGLDRVCVNCLENL